MVGASPAEKATGPGPRQERHHLGDALDPLRAPDFVESLFTSRFVISLLGFLVVCGIAATANFGRVPPSNFPERTWTGWAVQDLLSTKERPQVVFLGSSLMLVPLAGVDAIYLNRRLDGSQHHRSVYFEHLLKERTGRDIRTFNLALPGEMPSDAYLIADFLLDGKKRPDVIVYGLGPRDFMDNLLPSPAATDPFRNLARFGDIGHMLDRVMPDWIDRLNFEIGRSIYLYGLKTDLSAEAGKSLHRWLSRHVPVPEGREPYMVSQRRQILPAYRPNELARAEAFFRPEGEDRFADNLTEYRKRYRTVRWDTFTTQMRFFAELLDLARQRGIHVVVISMPITDINRQLIADYAWDAYRQSLHVLSTVKGATFLDLEGSRAFNLDDFMDTVHLHRGGGKKMLTMLAGRLSEDEAVRLALKLPLSGDGSKTSDQSTVLDRASLEPPAAGHCLARWARGRAL